MPQYIAWLRQQDWARDKFPHLINVTINNFSAEFEDTPEHNALQLRFLDERFRAAFVRTFPELRQETFRVRLKRSRDAAKGLRAIRAKQTELRDRVEQEEVLAPRR